MMAFSNETTIRAKLIFLFLKLWESEMGARFHYVSGGPWQYYPSIDEFLELADFPKARTSHSTLPVNSTMTKEVGLHRARCICVT